MTNDKNTTLKEALVIKIASLIINGRLKPGDRLPAERELAQKEGISRSAVHLAMVDLERMRFIETNARHGTYVCDFIQKGNIETLNLLIRLNGADLNEARIRDMLDMRLAIEGKAIELLLPKLSEKDIETLESDIEEASAIADNSEKSDRELAASFFSFHHDICVLSGNFILPLLFNTFEYATLIYWQQSIHYLGRPKCIELLEGFLRVIKKQDVKKCQIYLKQEFEIFVERISREEQSTQSD